MYGISRDSPWSHIAWTQALDLNVQLLSDWNADAVHAFGITRSSAGCATSPFDRRSSSTDGTVRGAWRYDPGEVPDLDELLAAARAS